MSSHPPADNPINPDDEDDLVIEESSHSAGTPAPASPKPKPGDSGGIPLEIEESHASPSPANKPRVHSGKPVGVPVEGEGETPSSTSTSRTKHLDVCPSCGANMPGPNEVVCLRCGFDLKTMKLVKTRTGDIEVDEDEKDNAAAARVLISPPGKGDLWLPGAMGGISALLIIIAYLSGSHGLFRDALIPESGIVEGKDRFLGLLQFIVLAGMWTGCGIAALAFMAHLLGMKLGDLRLTAVRAVGIVLTMSLVRLLNFNSAALEWIVEAIGMIGVFVALSMALFNLKPRDLPWFAGSAVFLFFALWLAGNAVVWATTSAV